MTQVEYPKTREEWLALRHKHVGSTEVAALFGLSPYSTAFELAVVKRQPDPDPEFEGNERMRWGIRVQHAIAKGIASEYGVKVRAISGYAIHSYQHIRAGASFDYEIIGLSDDAEPPKDSLLRDMYAKHGAGILEIKNVDTFVYRNDWTDGEPPVHIELQLQHQLACIGRFWGAIGALIGGNELRVFVRERDDAVHKAIVAKCEKFWADLDNGVMPPVDLPADADIVAKLYRYAEPGKVMDATGNEEIAELCRGYVAAAKQAREAEATKDTLKAKLLMLIGDAERVIVDGFNVSAGMVGDTEVPAYTRKGYRNVRITAKKPSKEKSRE